MTLVELLVGCGMLTMFVGMLYGLFVWGIGTWKKAEVEMSIEREGVLALDRLGREMRAADPGSLQFTWYVGLRPFTADTATPPTGSVAISFQTAVATSGAFTQDPVSLAPMWMARVIWYHDRALGTLVRKRIEMATPTVQATPLASPGSILDGAGAVLATGVTEFKVLDPTGATDMPVTVAANPARLTLTLQQVTSRSTLVETTTLTSLVHLNN